MADSVDQLPVDQQPEPMLPEEIPLQARRIAFMEQWNAVRSAPPPQPETLDDSPSVRAQKRQELRKRNAFAAAKTLLEMPSDQRTAFSAYLRGNHPEIYDTAVKLAAQAGDPTVAKDLLAAHKATEDIGAQAQAQQAAREKSIDTAAAQQLGVTMASENERNAMSHVPAWLQPAAGGSRSALQGAEAGVGRILSMLGLEDASVADQAARELGGMSSGRTNAYADSGIDPTVARISEGVSASGANMALAMAGARGGNALGTALGKGLSAAAEGNVALGLQLAPSAAQTFTTSLVDARDSGFSDAGAGLYAAVQTSIEPIITIAMQRAGAGGVENAYGPMREAIKGGIKGWLKAGGKSVVDEQVEELSIAIANDYLRAAVLTGKLPTAKDINSTAFDTAATTLAFQGGVGAARLKSNIDENGKLLRQQALQPLFDSAQTSVNARNARLRDTNAANAMGVDRPLSVGGEALQRDVGKRIDQSLNESTMRVIGSTPDGRPIFDDVQPGIPADRTIGRDRATPITAPGETLADQLKSLLVEGVPTPPSTDGLDPNADNAPLPPADPLSDFTPTQVGNLARADRSAGDTEIPATETVPPPVDPATAATGVVPAVQIARDRQRRSDAEQRLGKDFKDAQVQQQLDADRAAASVIAAENLNKHADQLNADVQAASDLAEENRRKQDAAINQAASEEQRLQQEQRRRIATQAVSKLTDAPPALVAAAEAGDLDAVQKELDAYLQQQVEDLRKTPEPTEQRASVTPTEVMAALAELERTGQPMPSHQQMAARIAQQKQTGINTSYEQARANRAAIKDRLANIHRARQSLKQGRATNTPPTVPTPQVAGPFDTQEVAHQIGAPAPNPGPMDTQGVLDATRPADPSGVKRGPSKPAAAAKSTASPAAAPVSKKDGKGWDRVKALADAYKANATPANLAAVKASIESEARAGNLDAPNGSPVTHVFQTEQGSVYVITKDGQTRRVKSMHSNTGTDHGLHGWNQHGIFMPSDAVAKQTGSAFRSLAEKVGLANTVLHFEGGMVKAKILDNGVWRDAKVSDAYPGAVKTGLMKDGVIAFPYTKTPTDGTQILEWETQPNGSLKSIHDGSGVTPGSVVDITTGKPADINTVLEGAKNYKPAASSPATKAAPQAAPNAQAAPATSTKESPNGDQEEGQAQAAPLLNAADTSAAPATKPAAGDVGVVKKMAHAVRSLWPGAKVTEKANGIVVQFDDSGRSIEVHARPDLAPGEVNWGSWWSSFIDSTFSGDRKAAGAEFESITGAKLPTTAAAMESWGKSKANAAMAQALLGKYAPRGGYGFEGTPVITMREVAGTAPSKLAERMLHEFNHWAVDAFVPQKGKEQLLALIKARNPKGSYSIDPRDKAAYRNFLEASEAQYRAWKEQQTANKLNSGGGIFGKLIGKITDFFARMRKVAKANPNGMVTPDEIFHAIESGEAFKGNPQNDAADVASGSEAAMLGDGNADPGRLVTGSTRPSDEASRNRQDLTDVEDGRVARVSDGAAVVQPPAEAYSLHNYEEWRGKTEQYLRDQGRSPAEVKKYLRAIDGQIGVITSLAAKEADLFPVSANDNERGPIRGNSDPLYKITFDLSAECVRRKDQRQTAMAIMDKIGRPLTGDETMATVLSFRAKGKTAPCLYCYVESPRRKQSDMLNTWKSVMDGKTQPKKAEDVPIVAAFREAGMDGMSIDFNRYIKPEDANANAPDVTVSVGGKDYSFQKWISTKVTAQVKALERYEEYSGQFLDKKVLPQDLLEYLNARAGIRFFSNSDFQAEHVVDLMQAVTDASARGARGHVYSKIPAFVEIFGKTGMKVNTSIFAKTVDGKVTEDSWQGMKWDDAKRLREEHPDVGAILVGTDDAQITWALDQPWVDYIIPYHHSGLAGEYSRALQWKDYTSVQREQWKDGKSANTVPKETVDVFGKQVDLSTMVNKDGKPVIRSQDYLDLDKGTSNALAKKRYLKICDLIGVDPVFPQFSNHPNYIKLKKDFARTDTPFRALQPKFNVDKAAEVTKGFIDSGGDHAKVEPDVVSDVVDRIQKANGGDIAANMMREQSEAYSLDQNDGEPARADEQSSDEYAGTSVEHQSMLQRIRDGLEPEEVEHFSEWDAGGRRILAKEGVDAFLKRIEGRLTSSKDTRAAATPEEQRALRIAFVRAMERGDSEQAARIGWIDDRVGTETARSLGARRFLISTPEGRREWILSHFASPPAAVKRALIKADGKPEQQKAILEKWRKKMDSAKESLKAEFGVDVMDPNIGNQFTEIYSLGALGQVLSNHLSPGLSWDNAYQTLVTNYRLALLTHPGTHGVNTASNAANFLKVISRAHVEAVLGSMLGGRPDAATVSEIMPMWRGIMRGFPAAISAAFQSYVANTDVTRRTLLAQSTTGSRTQHADVITPPGLKAFSTRPMAFADSFFRTWAGYAMVAQEAHRRAVSAGMSDQQVEDEIAAALQGPNGQNMSDWEKAMKRASEVTFQDLGEEGGDQKNKPLNERWATKAARAGNAFARLPMVSFVIPFVNTPISISAQTMALFPPAKAIAIATRGIEKATKGSTYGRDAGLRDAADLVLGSVLMAALSAALKDDDDDKPRITGVATDYLSNRGKSDMERGGQAPPPMSIRIGDTYRSYQWAAPAAPVIAGMIDTLRMMRAGKGLGEAFAIGTGKTLKSSVIDQAGIIETTADFTRGLLNLAREGADEYKKNTDANSGFIRQVAGNAGNAALTGAARAGATMVPYLGWSLVRGVANDLRSLEQGGAQQRTASRLPTKDEVAAGQNKPGIGRQFAQYLNVGERPPAYRNRWGDPVNIGVQDRTDFWQKTLTRDAGRPLQQNEYDLEILRRARNDPAPWFPTDWSPRYKDGKEMKVMDERTYDRYIQAAGAEWKRRLDERPDIMDREMPADQWKKTMMRIKQRAATSARRDVLAENARSDDEDAP